MAKAKEAKEKHMDADKDQVEYIDAHGNKALRDKDATSGPAHLKEKHPHGVNTGRRDAHGNEIWETPGEKQDEE
jgi:hypothetical protein